MKKKFMLVLLLFALMIGLNPHSITQAQTTNTQGDQFEQGKYDLQAVSPFGTNWNRNSPYAGTETNKIKWEYKLYHKDITEISKIPHRPYFAAQPAIGHDGTIYITSLTSTSANTSENRKLYALNPDGTLKWKKSIMKGGYSTPVIAEDGTIYVTADNLTAFNPDGSIKWQVKTPYNTTPVLDRDGTIYVRGKGGIDAYNPDGSKKWSANTIIEDGYSPSPLLLSRGGIIYTLVFSNNKNNYLYAHDKNGKELWEKSVPRTLSGTGFTLGINDEIFVNTQDKLYVFDKNGNIVHQWQEKQKEGLVSAPTVSSTDGTIYVGGRDYTYAYNPDYSLKWKSPTKGIILAAPVIDKNGVIYAKTDDELYALNPDGTLKWKMPKSPTAFRTASHNDSIIIGKDGTLYNVGIYYVPNNVDATYTSLIAIGDSYTDNVCTKESTFMEVLKSFEAKSKNAKLTEEEKKETREILNKLSNNLDKKDN
ncbi:PQQ-binding-like beta-propeller repeat protein [Bacillus sp. JJ1127]|uniref:PQQ-binding-like beta-propeller repeat protein n=1 Tax=Bacillus sp. JJ1127 TaxID=3122952 RepID=UPI002FFD8EE2